MNGNVPLGGTRHFTYYAIPMPSNSITRRSSSTKTSKSFFRLTVSAYEMGSFSEESSPLRDQKLGGLPYAVTARALTLFARSLKEPLDSLLNNYYLCSLIYPDVRR
jgi:hypothetical protein